MRNKLGSAINRRLSGVRLTAEDERALLAGVMERKDEIVKKKLSAAMVAAAVLVFLVITCAFAVEMNPVSTPIAPVDTVTPTPEPYATPLPTPTPELSGGDRLSSDGVVCMQMQYVNVQGTYVTMQVRLTAVQSELVSLVLSDPDSDADRYPDRWNLVIDRDELSLILPEALDSGRRGTTIADADENGITFTLFGWLKEETADAVCVTAATSGDCPPLSVSVNCAPMDATTTEIFSGTYEVNGAAVNGVSCIVGDDFASVIIDYTAKSTVVYAPAYGNYMHREPNCGGLQDAVRYDDMQDAQLADRKPCPVCWYDAADADTLFEDVYVLLNPGVDVPSESHPNPISDFAYAIMDDGSRVTYFFGNVELSSYGAAGRYVQAAHMDEDEQILFTIPSF